MSKDEEVQDVQEEEEQTTKIPDFIKILEDENIEVTTREGVFVMREPTGEEYDQVDRIMSRQKNSGEFIRGLMLVSRSLVKPKMGELDLKKLKMSTLKRLVDGMNIYGREGLDFLAPSVSSSKKTSGKERSSS